MQLVWQPYLSKTRLLCVRNSRGGPSVNTCGTPGAAVCLSQEPLYLVGGGTDNLRHLGGGRGEDSAALGQESLEVAVAGGSLTENGAPGSAPIPTPCPVWAGGVLGPGSVARYSEQRGRNRCFLESENNAGSQMGHVVEACPPQLCAKGCLSGEQQRVAGGGCGTSKAPGAPSSPTGLPTRGWVLTEGIPPRTKARPTPCPPHALLPSFPQAVRRGADPQV